MANTNADLLRRQNREMRDQQKVKARMASLCKAVEKAKEAVWDTMDVSDMAVLDDVLSKLKRLAGERQ